MRVVLLLMYFRNTSDNHFPSFEYLLDQRIDVKALLHMKYV
jgi:hypothetical protein